MICLISFSPSFYFFYLDSLPHEGYSETSLQILGVMNKELDKVHRKGSEGIHLLEVKKRYQGRRLSHGQPFGQVGVTCQSQRYRALAQKTVSKS